MLARCGKCQSKFVTETFGRQRCPVCDAELEIKDPSAAAPPSEPGSAPATAPAASPSTATGPDDATPWERRDTLGLGPAISRTLSQLAGDPAAFFGRIAGHSGDATFSWLLWVILFAGIPQALATWVSVSTTDWNASYEDLRTTFTQLQIPFDEDGSQRRFYDLLARPAAGAAFGAFVFVLTPVLVYVLGGLTHLGVVLTGGSKRPLDSTLRAFAYTFTPMVLSLVPACGNLIGFFWTVVLQYIAVQRLQETGASRTIVSAFLLPMVLLVCVFGLVATVLVGATAG